MAILFKMLIIFFPFSSYQEYNDYNDDAVANNDRINQISQGKLKGYNI